MAYGVNGYWTGSIEYTDQWGNYINIPLGETDEDGIQWYLVSLDGWDGVATVGSVTQQSSDHGGWPTPQFYGPRTMSLTVFAQAPDQATRDLARSKLQRAIPVNDFALFTYNEPIPKQCMVRRSGALPETYQTLSEAQFVAALVAADPRKYKSVEYSLNAYALDTPTGGWTLPTTLPLDVPDGLLNTNSVNLPNEGDFETRPVIAIQGPVTSPAVTSAKTGQTISFTNVSLSSTDKLVVDLYNRTARKNGSIVLADVMSSWWVIPPGGTDFIFDGNFTGAANANVTYRAAWQ